MPNTELDPVQQAAELTRLEQNVADVCVYTHMFRNPFQLKSSTAAVQELTFDFGSLTGNDYLAIEDDLIRHGKTLVVPEFTGDFLCGMASRACTLRDKNGVPMLHNADLRALPMRDFQAVCNAARRFLLRAES